MNGVLNVVLSVYVLTGPGRYSDSSIFRQFYIPTVLYSDRSIFRQVDIPTNCML